MQKKKKPKPQNNNSNNNKNTEKQKPTKGFKIPNIEQRDFKSEKEFLL